MIQDKTIEYIIRQDKIRQYKAIQCNTRRDTTIYDNTSQHNAT